MVPIDNMSQLVQVMVCHRIGDTSINGIVTQIHGAKWRRWATVSLNALLSMKRKTIVPLLWPWNIVK